MLHDLHELASRGIALQIVGARGQVRDILQADGLAEKTDSANWNRRMEFAWRLEGRLTLLHCAAP